jgi:hypothetical protein
MRGPEPGTGLIGEVDPDKGLRHVQKGIELLDTAREPRLELCAQHILASLLTDARRPQEALAVLDRARALYRRLLSSSKMPASFSSDAAVSSSSAACPRFHG